MRLPSKREFGALFGASAVCGCSLIYDLSPDQCGSNADCASFGENYVCEEGMCKALELPGECEESADCLAADQNTPRACIEQDPGRRSSRVCVPLRTQECPFILPIAADPAREIWREQLSVAGSIVIGAYGFLQQGADSADIRNYDLALTELADLGGVPGPDGTSRPVVAVVCDTNYDDNDGLYAGVDHLVRDLRVPGVIASLLSADLQLAFSRARSIEENPNVFFMSPVDNDDVIAGLPDQNLVWNNLPNGTAISPAYGPLLDRTLAYLESSGRVPAGEVIRVAVLVANDIRVVNDIGANLPNLIRFNDKSYQENFADGNLVRANITSSYDEAFATTNYTPIVDAILDLDPHVIFALGADEIFTRIINKVEERWEAEAPADQARPFYLLSPYGYNSDSIVSTTLAHGTPDRLSQRMAGVNWALVEPAYRNVYYDYLARMGAQYIDRPADLGYENWYDATWYSLYALAAGAGNRDNFTFSGLQLANGMERLLDGPETTVNPADFSDAMQQLAVQNSSVTLVGTMGLPTFDDTGAREGVGSVWCVTPSGMQTTDVLRVDDNGELVEDLGDVSACIPDF